jgi:hypothetical protein
MASIPSNGYAAVMAGTNVYTGSNFFGSDCPKTPIVPTDPDDLVNRAYVTSVIPPTPPTPPVTEFSYTNASNAIVPVAAPTASLQKLNLLASGVNPGIWSVLNLTGLTPLGAPSAVLIASTGEFWVATIPFGGSQQVPLLLRYSSDFTTILGYSYADNTAHNARINAIYEFNGSIFIGGNFERVAANIDPVGIVQYNIARFDPPFIFSQAPTQLGGGGINGVNGEVNAIWVGDTGSLNFVLVAGGFGINATLPTALGSPVSNLIVMSGAISPANTQSFSSCGGAFRVDGGGGVNTLLGVTGDAGVFIGGSFLTVGSSFISQPAFTRIDCLTGGGYGILIGSINGSVQDICFSTRVPALIQDVILVAGLFDLTAFGGSNGTCYFTISTNLISPAVALNPAVGGYKVNSVAGRDAVIFGGTSILMTNSVIGSTYWYNQGAASNAGSAVGLQSISSSADFWLGATSDVGFLRKYTAAVAPVATFQLPSARFRSATSPNNQYQNAVFSTAAGAQVFISGADLYWSPAGALTTGLTFS